MKNHLQNTQRCNVRVPDQRIYQGDQARILAIRERDRYADGAFVYGVLSTGIFCRPSCASRQARQENIRLFDAPHEAEQAGFRACKRCKPDKLGDAALIERAIDLIDQGESALSTKVVAAALNCSCRRLTGAFKIITGLTLQAFIKAHKAKTLRHGLDSGLSATEAVFDAGYSSMSRVYERSGALLGMTPGRYAGRGDGETISSVIVDSALGKTLVAWTSKGVVTILFGSDPVALHDQLTARFARARIESAKPADQALIAQVVSLIDDPAGSHKLPLVVRGTAFQERVWQALIKIPPGSTRSYQEIADAIGAPTAVRAVANACGANRLPIAIPCHRVIRSDGNLGGYAFGIERKKKLLKREAKGRSETET